MPVCVRAGCHRTALAAWWAMCTSCTLPLLEAATSRPPAVVDQYLAAGWDALSWAERIAPNRWGNAVDGDGWVDAVRCLAFASVVTGHSAGCPHTQPLDAALPVVALARVPGLLRSPACAEPLGAVHTTVAHACDRCAARPTDGRHRVALVTGASLIVVGQLCDGCLPSVLGLGWPASVDGPFEPDVDGPPRRRPPT